MRYYLNIGSNLGDRRCRLLQAITALSAGNGGCAVSRFVESEPWGFESDNTFLNVAVMLDTDLQPLDMLDRCQAIERSLGSDSHRDKNGNYVDRVVDIDIMAIDDPLGNPINISTPRLTVPHPHLYDRPFFLAPYRQLKEGRWPEEDNPKTSTHQATE